MNIGELLFELFGKGTYELEVCRWKSDEAYGNYHHEKFHIDIYKKQKATLISVDLKSSFNKTSQSPIHFIIENDEDLSKRKKARIQEAIKYLVDNEKDAGKFFGSMDGFDDVGEYVRMEFYGRK